MTDTTTEELRREASDLTARILEIENSLAQGKQQFFAGGKGMGIKSGDDTAFPLCADGPGRRGCHTLIGATGLFSRDQRRHLEQTYAARTRAILSPTTTKEPTWPEADTQTGCS